MKTALDCIPCFVRQALEAARKGTDSEVETYEILRKVLLAIADFDCELSPPQMAQTIHRIIRYEAKESDPYKDVKDLSIEFALSLEETVRETIIKSQEPFDTALRFSISGNILDFAVLSTWDDARIHRSFEEAVTRDLVIDEVSLLKERIASASSILFLGDNSGETVFDRLFIEQFPGNGKIFYGVKGGPVINDATRECAVRSGLDSVAEIIDNGADAPGTILSICSSRFQRIFKEADVIVSKGQANYETLESDSREIFFLLQIKCPVIGEHYGYKTGQWIGGRSLSWLNERGLLSQTTKTTINEKAF